MRHSANTKAAKQWGLKSDERLFIRARKREPNWSNDAKAQYYAYAVSGTGNARRHRYLGACNQIGAPRAAWTQQLFNTGNEAKKYKRW